MIPALSFRTVADVPFPLEIKTRNRLAMAGFSRSRSSRDDGSSPFRVRRVRLFFPLFFLLLLLLLLLLLGEKHYLIFAFGVSKDRSSLRRLPRHGPHPRRRQKRRWFYTHLSAHSSSSFFSRLSARTRACTACALFCLQLIFLVRDTRRLRRSHRLARRSSRARPTRRRRRQTRPTFSSSSSFAALTA